jgi:hypothetical protein
MSTSINLKELERRAFRRTYEDGLFEIYIGGMLMSFSVFAFNVFPGETFESLAALGLYLAGMTISCLVFFVGKKIITLPRIGIVNFGEQRKKRKRDLITALSVIVGIQVLALFLQFGLLASPELRARLTPFLGDQFGSTLAIAIVAVIFVAPGLLLMAYYAEIPHGYFYAAIISIGIFLMIILNQAWWMAAAGALLLAAGIVHLIRFLNKYPLPAEDESNAT